MTKFISALLLAFALLFVAASGTAQAEGCYNCSSGSSCNQCSYGSKDTGDARKVCEKRGCKITGTGSCSSAANVKKCALEIKQPIFAWAR